MIHVYHGDGKGKTTAACGLSLRAAGHGFKVLFAQFFKDGSSGEIAAMAAVPNIEIRRPPCHNGRYKTLSDGERAEIGRCYRQFLTRIIGDAESYDLIVLDESVSAYNYEVIDRQALLNFLHIQGGLHEIVLTGRGPAPELLALADYVTEMHKEKHPFDRGITAREGVEY